MAQSLCLKVAMFWGCRKLSVLLWRRRYTGSWVPFSIDEKLKDLGKSRTLNHALAA